MSLMTSSSSPGLSSSGELLEGVLIEFDFRPDIGWAKKLVPGLANILAGAASRGPALASSSAA